MGFIRDITGQTGAKAAVKAGEIQADAAREGIEEQRRQFDLTRADFAVRREGGDVAFGQQQALLGLSGVEAQQTAFEGLSESPGQKFLRDRQQRALLRNSSAIGGLGGGNVRAALQQQAVGFAQQDIDRQFGRLGQLAGQGLQATSTGAALGGQTISNITGLQSSVGQARASGLLGAAQSRQQGLMGLLELGATAVGGASGGGGGGARRPPGT